MSTHMKNIIETVYFVSITLYVDLLTFLFYMIVK